MARTRAQEKSGAPQAPAQTVPNKRSKSGSREDTKPASKKLKQEPTSKSTTAPTNKQSQKSDATPRNPKLQQLLDRYGAIPLSNTELEDPQSPKPETLLALILNAMLSSARISHELAAKSVACCIKAGYHKLDVLKKSTWQERTEVLTEGRYTRYREKTATAFGELAEFIESKYGGDLNDLISTASKDPIEIRAAIKDIKGLGDVGADIFFDTAQGVVPSLAPFLDPRSKKTAEAIGIDSDVNKLWKQVGEDPVEMCKLASALTTVRLEKAESSFK